MPSLRSLFSAAVLSMFLANVSARAQVTTADIVGTVVDPSGAAVTDAKVTITNLGTQDSRSMQTGSSGDYAFNLVQPGHYSLHVETKGFKAFDAKDVVVGAGDRLRVDAQMQVGATSETVEVSGEAPALQTDSSTVQETITEQAVQDLPLNARNVYGLVQVQAGVNSGPPNAISSGQRSVDRRPTSSFSANGQSDLLNNNLVDGLDNNERSSGLTGIRPSIDALAEVRVLTNDYSAEYGRTAGAVVNMITKSGTNDFHGSLFEFFRNNVFDARDFFSINTPEYRQNQFGGSLGGRIIKNKTFFFADVEESRIIQASTQTSTVPTSYERQHPGDFSDVGGPIVPSTRFNPIGVSLFNLYPLPNKPGAVNNYVSNPKRIQYATTLDLKIDHHFNDSNTMSATYDYNPVSTELPGSFPVVKLNGLSVNPSPDFINGGASIGTQNATSQGSQLSYVHIFRPELLLELKAGFTRINIASLPLNYGTNVSEQLGFVNANISSEASALAQIVPIGYTGLGSGFYLPNFDVNNTFQYHGVLTYAKGSHNIRMGAALIRRQLNQFGATFSPTGGFFFQPIPGLTPYTNAMANLLVGTSTFAFRGNQLYRPGYRFWEPSVFVQDDWRATRWLTLNLGLRYEIFTPASEAHNSFSNFDMNTLKIVLPGQGTNSTLGVKTDYTNVAPRLGFAASLGHSMVVRGGFGISYYPAEIQGAIAPLNPPFFFQCLPCLGTRFPTLPLPVLGSITNPSGLVTNKPPDFRPSYLRQFNLFFQKEIAGNVFSIGGLGEQGRNLLWQTDLDRPAPPGPGKPTPALIYATQLPAVTGINTFTNRGISNYYALQTTFARRYKAGLTLNANYTWAHGLSDSDNGSGSSNNSGLLPNNPLYDYGNSDLDIRHRVALSATYEIPFGKSLTGVAHQAVAGWRLNVIGFYQTGLPFTVTNQTPAINLPGVTSDRPNQVAPWQLPNPDLQEWFNTAAFQVQTPGTPGNEGRNPLYGPPLRALNLSMFKDFRLVEPWTLQFRAECFNVTNTANFGAPNAGIGLPGFGTISSTALGANPRQFQFALKLLF